MINFTTLSIIRDQDSLDEFERLYDHYVDTQSHDHDGPYGSTDERDALSAIVDFISERRWGYQGIEELCHAVGDPNLLGRLMDKMIERARGKFPLGHPADRAQLLKVVG